MQVGRDGDDRKMLVVNYKNYPQVLGEGSVVLTRIIEKTVGDRGDVRVVVAPPPMEVYRVVQNTNVPVFSQHLSGLTPGSRTGEVLAESVKESGAVGTLINHSEKRMLLSDISLAVEKARNLGLETVVCTDSLASTRGAAVLMPDFVAIEPPELIGGDISVSTARPELISGAVEEVRRVAGDKVRVLCGAGVKNGMDVKKALDLGAEGVLLASGIVKAKDPGEALKDILSGF